MQKQIKLFLENNLISDIADLYSLKKEDIIPLPRIGEKSAENIVNAIEQSKEISLDRFIYGLGIKHVGAKTAKILSSHAKSLEKIKELNVDELQDIHDIGVEVANSIVEFFSNSSNLELIDKLIDNKIKIINPVNTEEKEKPLTDQVFVITGSFLEYKRKDIADKIEELGGKVSSSIFFKHQLSYCWK